LGKFYFLKIDKLKRKMSEYRKGIPLNKKASLEKIITNFKKVHENKTI